MEDLKGKVSVVTGGASGIGRALCWEFAREGAHVVVADLDEAGMAETAAGVTSAGTRAVTVRTDVSKLASVQALAERAWKEFGGVHVLCNNAGVVVHGGLEAATHRDWEWILGVNLWGVIHGVETFVPRMIAQKQPGHIVNTASMAGLIASQGLGVYNTSKYAVVGLSETLQKDLRRHNIGVSVLCPMGVSTNIRASERSRPAELKNPGPPPETDGVQLIGRYLTPEDVAGRVLRAVKANRLYVVPHDEAREPLRRRFERMDKAFEEST
jgi:NAD(P)-dependent dehydrogenase (short-subunit alcohol dehydrogenase family)